LRFPELSCELLGLVEVMSQVCWPSLTETWLLTGRSRLLQPHRKISRLKRSSWSVHTPFARWTRGIWQSQKLVAPGLAEPGEEVGFATRDAAQSAAAVDLGFLTAWGMILVGSVDGLSFNQDRFTVTAGRMADPSKANEVVVNRDRLDLFGPPLRSDPDRCAQPTSGNGAAHRVSVRIVGISLLNRESS